MTEEERQAAIQQQEEAFAAYIKPRLEEMRRVVSAYSIEQERLKDFYQTIKKRQHEVNRIRSACHNVKSKRQDWKAHKPPAMP